MFKRILLLILILPLFSQFSLAQEQSTELTLSRAIEMALDKNYSIKVAKQNAQIGANNATLGNAGLLPTVDASAGVNAVNESFEATGPIFNIDTTGVRSDILSASVNASYVLFDGFGNYYRFQSLKNLKDQSGVASRLQIEGTLLNVIQDYLNVLANREAVAISEASIQRSLERLQRVQKRFDLGVSTRLDLLTAQVDLNTDSVAFVQSQAAFENAKRTLNINLGLDPTQAISVIDDLSINELLILDDLLLNAESENASLVLSKLSFSNSELNLKSEKSRRFPVVSLTGSYAYTNVEGGAGIFNSTITSGLNGGISVRLNIFNGAQQETRIKNALISMKNSREEYELARISLRRDVLNAHELYRSNLFLLAKEDINLETAELSYKRASDLFELGQITSTELREAQINLSRVEQRIVNLKIQAKISEVQLYQLSGQLIGSAN